MKELSKDTLEGLGFKYHTSDKDGRTFDSYKLDKEVDLSDIHPVGKPCKIYLIHYHNWDYCYAVHALLGNHYTTLFDGRITNTEELKQVLKLIGI